MVSPYFPNKIRGWLIIAYRCVLRNGLGAFSYGPVVFRPMNKPPSQINIFLSLDREIFRGYFNPQDPAPIYKRQLSHEFEQYIMTCIKTARRDSAFNFKISYRNDSEKEYAEPLLYAIRQHFGDRKMVLNASFEKFKRRTYVLLFVSLAVVMMCQGLVPLVLKTRRNIPGGLTNGLDVFSWVILWRPIDKLIFHWNPFLKDISIADRIKNAQVVMNEIES
jgi:hypothetical protein